MALPSYDEYVRQHSASRRSGSGAGTALQNEGRALDVELKRIELEKARSSSAASVDPVGESLLADIQAAAPEYTPGKSAKTREQLIGVLSTKYGTKLPPEKVASSVYQLLRGEGEAGYAGLDQAPQFSPSAQKGEKALTAEAAKGVGNAETGLRAVQEIRDSLAKNKHTRIGAALPFNPGAQTYSTAVNNAVDIIARLRSGAAITEQEEKSFKRLLPKLTDKPQTVEYKLSELEQQFRRVAEQDPKNRQAQPQASGQAEDYKKLYGIEY